MTQQASRALRLALPALLGVCVCACRGDAPARSVAQPNPAKAAATAPATAAPRATTIWDFESDTADAAAPSGFTAARTGPGRDGRWVVRSVPDAPTGQRVVAQLDDDGTDVRFALLIAEGSLCTDFRLATRCRPLSGAVDQAVGLVFRLRDADNYYLARANAIEGNLRLYRVKAGHREQLASWEGAVAAGQWHELAVEARGEHLAVIWDGARVIETTDALFRQPGRVGLWTKADSISEFDQLSLERRDG